MRRFVSKGLSVILSVAMLVGSFSVSVMAQEGVSEESIVLMEDEAQEAGADEEAILSETDAGTSIGAPDGSDNETGADDAVGTSDEDFEIVEGEAALPTEDEGLSEDDALLLEDELILESKIEESLEDDDLELNSDIVYTNQEELNQAIRDAFVNRETGVDKTKTFYISGDLEFNRNEIFDFLEERDGMKANEGDYLNFTTGHPTKEAFDYTDCTEYLGEKFEVSTQFITSKAQEDAVDAKVNSLLSSGGALYSAAQSNSNDAKAKAAFDWIQENVASSTGNRRTPIYHTAYSAFINGHATCQGYSLAYYRLVREMGVPCKIIMGTDANAHTYTITKMDDGYYYYVDPSQGIFKRDYNHFARTTEQDHFRSTKYVQNYISKIKGYGEGPVNGNIELFRCNKSTGEETLITTKDKLHEIRQAIYDDFALQLQEEGKPDKHPDIGSNSHFSDFDSYRIVLRDNVTSTSMEDFSFIEFSSPELRNEWNYTGGTDLSPLVDVDLNGYTVTTAKASDLFIYANSVSNGTINMASNTYVYLEAPNPECGDTWLGYGGCSNVIFKGADGTKAGPYFVDKLIIGPGVHIEDTCTISGIPCVNMVGGIIDCDFTTTHLYIHDETDKVRRGYDQYICLNASVNTQYMYIEGSHGFYGSGVRRVEDGYGFANPIAVKINNLNVSKGTKISECNELKIYGNVNLNTLVKITDYSSWVDQYYKGTAYNWGLMNPSGFPDRGCSQTRIDPLTVKIMSVKDSSGVEVSRGSLNMSGTLDVYQLGNGSEYTGFYEDYDWGDCYHYTGHYAAITAMDILPVSVDASGNETACGFTRGDVVGSFNMSGIKYPNKNKVAVTSENLSDYINIVGAAGAGSNPAVEYGQLIMSAPFKALTFDANGGVTPEEGRRIYAGKTYGTLPVPTRARQEFVGWFTDPEGGTMVTAATETPATDEELEDVTLYAHWEKTQKAQAPVISAMKSSGYSNDAGEWSDGTKVQIIDEIEGAEIWYTLDGRTPTKNGAKSHKISSGDVIVISETGDGVNREGNADGDRLFYNITAKAFHEDYLDSDTANLKVYVINTENDWGDIDENDREIVPGGQTVKYVLGDKLNKLWVAFDNKSTDADGYAAYDYTGKAITPRIRIYSGTKLLKEKTDYALKFTNNVNAAEHDAINPKNGKSVAPTINVKPSGNYAGAAFDVCFTINPIDISADEFTANDAFAVYKDGKTQKPSTTLLRNGKKLGAKDYKVEWSSEAGSEAARTSLTYGTTPVSGTSSNSAPYWVRITGQGNYTGVKYQKFVVSEEILDLSKAAVGKIVNQKYSDWCDVDGKLSEGGVCPDADEIIGSVILNKKVLDYPEEVEVTYSDNEAVGKAKVIVSAIAGSTHYYGSITTTFIIDGYKMSNVKVDGIAKSYPYTGEAVKPLDEMSGAGVVTPEGISIYYQNSKNDPQIPLKRGIDYEVSYSNNIKGGLATVILTGKGAYSGTVKKTYKIDAFEIKKGSTDTLGNHIAISFDSPDVGDANASGNNSGYYFVKGGVQPKVTVYFYPKGIDTDPSEYVTLVSGTDYTVKYSNNANMGTYDAVNPKNGKSSAPTVTVTGKNSFKGLVYSTFTILPANIANATITAVDKAASTKGNAYYSVPTVSAVNNACKTVKLTSGTDYDKTIKYTYVEDTIVTQNVNKKVSSVVRKAGKDVEKDDIVPAGTRIRATVTGKGNYSGSLSVIYRVFKNSISKVTFTVVDKEYTGNPITLTKGSIDKDTLATTGDLVAYTGKKDSPDTFTQYVIVGYKDNVSKGTATVTVQGIGEYGGTKDIKFKIVPKK